MKFPPYEGQPGGVTGTVLLAESHLAIHTWPETGSVTIDVYVCNFSADNSGKARRLMEGVIDAFAPKKVLRQQLMRGVMQFHLLHAAGAQQLGAQRRVGA